VAPSIAAAKANLVIEFTDISQRHMHGPLRVEACAPRHRL
jgi:hypothetical protein